MMPFAGEGPAPRSSEALGARMAVSSSLLSLPMGCGGGAWITLTFPPTHGGAILGKQMLSPGGESQGPLVAFL